MPDWLIAFLGIIVGFFLNEVSSTVRQRIRRVRAKSTLWDELQSIRFQLKQKVDIANQVKSAIDQGRMMSGRSVPIPSTAYVNCFPLLLDTLTPIERDNVRHIYSILAVLDAVMDGIEDDFKADVSGTLAQDAKQVYIRKLQDVINAYNTTRSLIESLMSGTAKDIYGRFPDP